VNVCVVLSCGYEFDGMIFLYQCIILWEYFSSSFLLLFTKSTAYSIHDIDMPNFLDALDNSSPLTATALING